MSFSYDMEVRIGYGWFSLPDTHPFYRAAVQHDHDYDEIIAGVADFSLKDADRKFLRNCLKLAAGEAWLRKSPFVGWELANTAWLFYRIVRLWAKVLRPELESYQPKKISANQRSEKAMSENIRSDSSASN